MIVLGLLASAGVRAQQDCQGIFEVPVIENAPQTPCAVYLNEEFPFEFGTPDKNTASEIIALYGSNVFHGDIEISGDFEIDVPFTFEQCKVRIDKDIKIIVKSGQRLNLKSSLLFSCREWNGIDVENLGQVVALDCQIEDAQIAIEAPRSCTLAITQTNFNRNGVGIQLGYAGPVVVGPPVLPNITQFSGNTFNCTSQLNTGGISTAGIQVYKCSPTLGAVNSAVNSFLRMRYGIRIEEQPAGLTTLVRRCDFLALYFDGIYLAGEGLNLFRCNFTNCAANGINAASTSNLIVRTCGFIYDDGIFDFPGPQTDFYRGIFCDAFAPASTVEVRFCDFNVHLESTNKQVDAILFDGGETQVGSNTAITIARNAFTLDVNRSRAIRLRGAFLEPQRIDIQHNNFTLSRNGTASGTMGITVESGIKRRLAIAFNDFFGESLLSFNSTDCIFLGGSVDDDMSPQARNLLGSNQWHFPCEDDTPAELQQPEFAYQLRVSAFDNTTYCENEFFAGQHPVTFTNTSANTIFTRNIFLGVAYGLELTSNGIIGDQPHMGNRWERHYTDCTGQNWTFDVNPLLGFHARCNPASNAGLSHFLVHQPQSTTTLNYPYHPRIIIPDDEDQFFEYIPGETPNPSCMPFIAGPPRAEYQALADGLLNSAVYSPAGIWAKERGLFRYLSEYPQYQSAHPSFNSFMAQRSGTKLDYFVQVARLLDHPSPSGVSLSASFVALGTEMAYWQEALDNLDSLLELAPTAFSLIADKAEAMTELAGLGAQYAALKTAYHAECLQSWQQAQTINNSIAPVTAFEANEKVLNQIILNQALTGSAALTATEAAFLNTTAQLDPQQGGSPVFRARALLSSCAWTEYPGEATPMETELAHTQSLVQAAAGLREPGQRTRAQVLPAQGAVIALQHQGAGDLQVFESTGRLMYKIAFAGDANRQLALPQGLAAGSYIVRVAYQDGQTELIRLFLNP